MLKRSLILSPQVTNRNDTRNKKKIILLFTSKILKIERYGMPNI